MPPNDTQKPDTGTSAPPAPAGLEELAEKYLDFWQQNLTVWATDPKALERWVETLSAGQPAAESGPDEAPASNSND